MSPDDPGKSEDMKGTDAAPPDALAPITAKEGAVFGLLLLGQITGILVATTVAGYALDAVLKTSPIFLGLGVVVGSLWATITVLLGVRRKLVD